MSEDFRELYRPEPREDSEETRLSRTKPRFCARCDSFSDHHTDRHPADDDDPEPSPGELVGLLADARKAVKG